MKPQDQDLANIAEAAKRVMNKETEVQPSDKDFVDLHSIDKGKRRGSTPLTEKDIDEANEFTKAAAKAAVAGDDEFEFDGKKFPTEMDVEVAKKILGESVEIDEATMSSGVKMAAERIYALENQLKVGSAVNKGVNKALGGKYDGDFKDMAKAIDKVISVWEEIEFQYGQSESTDLDEAFIDVDASDPKSPEFKKLLKKYRVKMKIITMKGPGGGMPLVKLSGKKKDLEGILKDPNGWQDDGFLADFIEEGKFDKIKKKLKSINPETLGDVLNGKIKLDPDERKEFDSYMADAKKMFANLPKSSPIKNMFGKEFVKALESVDVKESTAEYAKSLEKIANDRKMKNLSKEDKATLIKIAAMMAKEDLEEEETDDFEPHWMYDPETGEKERAEKPEDHERLKALGWGHEPPVKEGKVFEENYPKKLEKATTQADILKLYPKAKFSNRNLFGKPHPGGVVALSKTMALKFYFKDTDHRGTKMAKTDKFDVWSIWYYKPGSRKPISLFGDFFKSK